MLDKIFCHISTMHNTLMSATVWQMNNSNEIHYQEQTILILQRSMHREIVARQLTVSMISHMAKSLISSDKTSKIA